jgi:hypothetical protein
MEWIVPIDRHRQEIRTQLWADSEEHESWKLAAMAEGMKLSAWLRRAANRAVEVEAKQERIREVLS